MMVRFNIRLKVGAPGNEKIPKTISRHEASRSFLTLPHATLLHRLHSEGYASDFEVDLPPALLGPP